MKECLRLRVKDVDFERKQVTVRNGKGDQDRWTVLAASVIAPLREHLSRVKLLHEQDVSKGHGEVYLPHALERKYPAAAREWGWQYIFPSRDLSSDPRGGKVRRHHASGSAVDKTIKLAVRRTGIAKRVTSHTFRHSFATHLVQRGLDVRRLQELMGHKDISTTMIYLHVLEQDGHSVQSPLDRND